jgi:general secretion pathway protein M
MSDAPDARIVRAAALAAFVVLPVLAAALIGFNLVRVAETEELAARQEQLLAQLDARLARVDGGSQTLGDTTPLYLPATSASLAGAALQKRLVEAVETAGGRVIETQSVEEIEPDAEDDVRLRITLDVDNAGLLALMHGLETGLPLMTLESVSVRQLPSQRDEAGDNPTLRVDLVVRGYWKAVT